MINTQKFFKFLWRCLFIVVTLGFPILAEGVTISFDDPQGLLNVYPNDPNNRAARGTFANNYIENGMIFRSDVIPRDPRLGPPEPPTLRCGHYHLFYNEPGLEASPPPNPENFPRSLGPGHQGGCIVQMTYEPNNDGIRHLFNLLEITVLRGKLNVGVEFADGSIGVFNDLTAGPTGTTWLLIGGNNLQRATLEAFFHPDHVFVIRDISFEPLSSPLRTTLSATSTPDPPVVEARAFPLTVLPPLPFGSTPEELAIIESQAPGLEATKPSCALTEIGTNVTGENFVEITAHDTDGGLESIEVLIAENTDVSIPPIPGGTTDPVVVTAIHISQAIPSSIELEITDAAGNITQCESVMTTLKVSKGFSTIQTFTGIPKENSFLNIQNGNPGLKEVLLIANDRGFRRAFLRDHQTITLDISDFWVSPQNTLTLIGIGKPRDSAFAVIGDSPLKAERFSHIPRRRH